MLSSFLFLSSCLCFVFSLSPCAPQLPHRLWLLDSLLPASSLPSLAAQLCLLPCPSGSIHLAALLLSVSFTSLRRSQLSQPGFCLHLPGTSLPLSLTVAVPCALEFIRELVYLVALGLLPSAYHSETLS